MASLYLKITRITFSVGQTSTFGHYCVPLPLLFNHGVDGLGVFAIFYLETRHARHVGGQQRRFSNVRWGP